MKDNRGGFLLDAEQIARHTGALDDSPRDRFGVITADIPRRHLLRRADARDVIDMPSPKERQRAVHETGTEPIFGERQARTIRAQQMLPSELRVLLPQLPALKT